MKVATVCAVVCLSLWLSMSQVSGFQVPPKLNKTIQNLLQHYNIPLRERFNGKPVFSKEALTAHMEVRRVFLGGVLETYERLLDKMLKQLPTPSPLTSGSKDPPASGVSAGTAGLETGEDVRKGLSDILEMVQKLRKRNYDDLDKVLQGVHSLSHIEFDNAVVQSKALWELPLLYEEASTLERRRRRRQARKLRIREAKTQGSRE
ncbi:interferon gamma-like [Betta splendens]|uniref:Interferon gamma-like n=1 Tax=Betta splendens TaxID=158456 RepID=A0A6P7NL04_BETSP|nr:interferon gamma-like [Betta splendens]